jgi:hypothetical protein
VNGIVQQRRNRWITNSDPANAAAEATHEATTVRAAATLFGTLARRTTGAERRTLATITAGLNREAGALDRTAAAAGLTLGLSAGCDRDWHTAQAELRAGRRGIARAFDEPLLTVTPADEATEQLRQLTLCAIAVRTALSAPIAPPVTVAQATAAIHTAADDLKRRADAAVTITPATSRLRQRVSSAAGHELRVLEIVRAMNAGALTLRAAAAQINTQFGAADADISAALADLHSQGA